MPAFVLLSAALLVFAATSALLYLEFQPAALVALFMALPLLQKVAWLLIGLVPLALVAVTLLQHFLLMGQRKVADALEARLRGLRRDLRGAEQGQKESDDASRYLQGSDIEDTIGALQVQVSRTEQAVGQHQQRMQGGNLIVRVEEICQQQQAARDKLGELIAQRRALAAQLQGCQDDVEQTMSAVEQDKHGETVEDRVQKLSEFVRAMNSRCQGIEYSMPGLVELKQKLGALEARIAPLDDKETGVVGVLKASSAAGDRLAVAIARLEQDDGVSLQERIRELAETKRQLEERISSLFAQFSAIESIHKDINGLFAKLAQSQRPGKGVEGVTPISVLASAQAG